MNHGRFAIMILIALMFCDLIARDYQSEVI